MLKLEHGCGAPPVLRNRLETPEENPDLRYGRSFRMDFYVMQTSVEEFLYLTLWTADSFLRPSWHRLDESFESWAHRNHLGRTVTRLEQRQFLEQRQEADLGRFYRLTAEGRRVALGGRDPVERWGRRWDGRWRFLLFDLPVRATALRNRLLRFLLQHAFGYLQQSVWVTPDSLSDTCGLLRRIPADAESLTLFEGRPCGGESDAAIVRGAWDFDAINARYALHLAVVRECPDAPAVDASAESRFWSWARREREAWNSAVRPDPLLPRPLLPPDYGGPRSWQARQDVFRRLGPGFRSPERRSRLTTKVADSGPAPATRPRPNRAQA